MQEAQHTLEGLRDFIAVLGSSVQVSGRQP